MAIRNSKLGGNDFSNGEVLNDFDLDDTNNTIIDMIGASAAQNAYQILQANDIFENKDFLMVDEFKVSNGTNTTVNTSTTSSFYTSTNTYILPFTDEANGDTTHNPNSFTSPANAFDSNDTTYAEKGTLNDDTNIGSVSLGKTFTQKFVGEIRVKGSVQYSNPSTGGQNISISVLIETFDGTNWASVGEVYQNTSYFGATNQSGLIDYDGKLEVNGNVQGIRARISTSDLNYARFHSIEYGKFDTSSVIEIDSNTLTLGGTEKSAFIYTDSDIPTNTNIVVNISDGATTISSPINTTVGLNTLNSGPLSLTFNLSTTDNTKTPSIKGYGVFIK